ncbi:hypothetical protein KDL29_02010 [bacterium]|nr:hypothetical protein [bacterium]
MQYGDSWITENEHLLGGGQPRCSCPDSSAPSSSEAGFATIEILRRFAREYRELQTRLVLDRALLG